MVIYRMSDRIPVKLGELTFWIAPLSVDAKGRLLTFSKRVSGEERDVAMEGAAAALKLSVKGVDGLKLADGSPYECEFDEQGNLTDDCVSELMQLDCAAPLTRLCIRWGLDTVRDPRAMRSEYEARVTKLHTEGKLSKEELEKALLVWPMDGVEVDFSAVKNVKKKATVPSQVH